jgi:bifunctional DNA-binding transcriptional regulator/antitoxin component of YhaV-PrlF toxin-antitoxin module
MSLMRVFITVNAEGTITLPLNIRREAGLKHGQLLELRIIGAGKQKKLMLSARNNTR